MANSFNVDRPKVGIGILSVLIILITVFGFLLLCRDPSDVAKVEFGALLWAEVVLACASFDVAGLRQRSRAFGAALAIFAVWYLVFVVVMVIPAALGMGVKLFSVLHLLGFAIAAVFCVAHSHALSDIKRQDASDARSRMPKLELRTEMLGLRQLVEENFPGDKDLMKSVGKVEDDVHFAATSKEGLESLDQELADAISRAKDLAEEKKADELKKALSAISKCHQRREMMARQL